MRAARTMTPARIMGLAGVLACLWLPARSVGPYAEGRYVMFVPWETLKPYLTTEGAKIFAGARPKGDADDQQ